MGGGVRILVSGTTRTLSRLSTKYPHHLGFLAVPTARNSLETICAFGLPWAIDNGAFSGLDEAKFCSLIERASKATRAPAWVVAPDVVADAKATVQAWQQWRPRLEALCLRPCFVLQDGQEDLELPESQAYFIGGSTEWKLSRCAADLANAAKSRGAWLHVGRVNSRKRLKHCYDIGADSVDGTGFSRWGDCHLESHLLYLLGVEAQAKLFGVG